MKIVVAIDSFKGSLTSLEAGNSILKGIKKVISDAEVIVTPIADGGEGTVDALVSGLNGKLINVNVLNPLGEEITTSYGIIKDNTAVIEMASASGLTLIPESERNPFKTTTYGVGQMIKDAILKGCTNFIIGIGGSATNDGGVGMLQALGYEFLDGKNKPISFGANGLARLCTISAKNALSSLKNCTFNIACDVKNPLCGINGASRVFAPQKGAKKDDIPLLDKYLLNYANLTKKHYPNSNKDLEGAGAAGGMGFAFSSYLNANLLPGIELVLKETGFATLVKGADLVITGEGKIDEQTAMGKAPVGIAKIAKSVRATVIAFAGAVSYGANVVNDFGIDAVFPIVRGACKLEDAMKHENATRNLEETVEQVMRLYLKAKNT
ncbi:MAG: glycerate kinase [Clostridia bacterium]|nr:glycerate kinase [Clostridia bacterium]